MASTLQALVYTFGGRVGMYCGDISGLVKDIQDLRPTILIAKPRFLNNVYNRICYKAKAFVPSKLMALAISSKEAQFKE